LSRVIEYELEVRLAIQIGIIKKDKYLILLLSHLLDV
jgi:hypothetical protein